MNIVVCYKIVPDEEGIAIKADRSVDVSGAQWSLGEYDLEALEAAVQLRDSVGGKVTVLTVGGDEVLNSKLKKSILSRGADDQIVVCSEAFANLDAYCTAEVLARALGSTEYDLVLCGEGSSDMYSQQVGMILGQMLGLPVFNAVSSIAPAENGLLIGRSLDDCEELIEITLPAVLSAAAGIATPRIPSMKDILAGGKKPQIQLDGADIKVSAAVRCVRSTLAPESTERKQMICFTCPHQLDLPEEIEARLVDKMMVTAEKYIPGLSEHIIIKEVLFNSDIMTASGKGGAGIGIGQVAGQTGAYRPKIKLPVEGAYVVGAAAGGAGVGTELAVNSAIEFFDNYCK